MFTLNHMKLGIIVASTSYENEWPEPFGNELLFLSPLRDSLVP